MRFLAAAKRLFEQAYLSLIRPGVFQPPPWKGRLPGVSFRQFAPADLDRCIEIYTLNEPGRFPPGYDEHYRRGLERPTSYYLAAELDGQIVATGGISYHIYNTRAVLSFGLVHPDYQGRGIGTALVLARLALLDPARPRYRVVIHALKDSIAYYRRFGFLDFEPWTDEHGQEHPAAHLLISSSQIGDCRRLLAERGILVPQNEGLVPLRGRWER